MGADANLIKLRDFAALREVLGITRSRKDAKSFLLLARGSQSINVSSRYNVEAQNLAPRYTWQ